MSEPTTALVEAPATKSAIAGMAMVPRGQGGGVVLLPTTFAEVIAVAQMMAQASHAIPKHLRENPGACMAVVLRSSNWEMDPFAVATKTYMVNDILAYESQLVSAVVNMRAPVKGRPKIVYEGEGPDLCATFSYEMLDGDVLEYRSPKVKDIKVKNSPLWTGDPGQQLFYFCARAWARRWVPEVLMGVYTPDEVVEQVPEEAARPTSFADLEARAGAGDQIQDAVVEDDGGAAAKAAQTAQDKPKAGARIAKAKEVEKPLDPQPASVAAAPDAQAQAASPASGAGTATGPGTPGSGDTTTTASARSAAVSMEDEIASGGHAGAGERYLVGGDTYSAAGFRASYVDGVGVDNVSRDEAAGMMIYSLHPPRPTETANAQDAATGPDSSASATDASTASQEDSSFPGDSGPAVTQPKDVITEGYPELGEKYHLNGDVWAQSGYRDLYLNGELYGEANREMGALIYEDHRPERAEPAAAPTIPAEVAAYMETVAAATDWPTIQEGLRVMKQPPATVWPSLYPELQIRIHVITFTRLQELRKAGYNFNWLENLHAYRCYIDTEWNAEALKQNRTQACSGKTWIDLPTAAKIAFDKAHDAQFKRIAERAKQGADPAPEFS